MSPAAKLPTETKGPHLPQHTQGPHLGLEQQKPADSSSCPWTVLREREALSRGRFWPQAPAIAAEPLEKAPCSRRTQGHGEPHQRPSWHPTLHSEVHLPRGQVLRMASAHHPRGRRLPCRWQAPGTGGGSRLSEVCLRNSGLGLPGTSSQTGCALREQVRDHEELRRHLMGRSLRLHPLEQNLHRSLGPGGRVPAVSWSRAHTLRPPPAQVSGKRRRRDGRLAQKSAPALISSASPEPPLSLVTSEDGL